MRLRRLLRKMGILKTKYGVTGIVSLMLCIPLFHLLRNLEARVLLLLLAILTVIDLALMVYFNEPEEVMTRPTSER